MYWHIGTDIRTWTCIHPQASSYYASIWRRIPAFRYWSHNKWDGKWMFEIVHMLWHLFPTVAFLNYGACGVCLFSYSSPFVKKTQDLVEEVNVIAVVTLPVPSSSLCFFLSFLFFFFNFPCSHKHIFQCENSLWENSNVIYEPGIF